MATKKSADPVSSASRRRTKPASSELEENAMREATASRTGVTRARTPEEKETVRQRLIDAGRRAFAEQDYSKVSLRSIAVAAGYTPALVYHYFDGRQALLRAIRETDLDFAVERFSKATEGVHSPADRLRKLLVVILRHWRANFEQYDILFSAAAHPQPARTAEPAPFGQSEIALRAYQLYHTAVEDFFDSLPRHPIPLKLATDCIVVSIHGAVAVPVHLGSMKWVAGEKLAMTIADTFITAWTVAAELPRE